MYVLIIVFWELKPLTLESWQKKGEGEMRNNVH